MFFTGNNTLRLQRANEFSFAFNNIRVSDWGECRFIFSGLSFEKNIFLRSGFILSSNKQTVLSSYNTGEPFSLSGWFINDASNNTGNICYILANSVPFVERNCLRQTLDAIGINVGAENLQCDVEVSSSPFSYSLSMPETFRINGTLTGIYSSDIVSWVYGHRAEFYNSLEESLTGNQIIGCLGTGQERLIFNDNDSSQLNNEISWKLSLFANEGEQNLESSTERSGLFDVSIENLTGFNNSNIAFVPFEGTWSGNNFLHSGTNSSITLSYYASKIDGLGNIDSSGIHITGRISGIRPIDGNTYSGVYITGFTLTSSGEYLDIPFVKFSGYYYVTGIQQNFNTLLFSSGCTGNLGINFSGIGNFGTGATGKLLTTRVLFQDVYGSGNQYFYVVNGYSGIGVGSGYTQAPRAIINTGEWGTGCFDIPLKSGYNEGWFSPFNTYGAIDIAAGYLTGEVLYTTGTFGTGITGYKVTGIDITNLGSGYSSGLRPIMNFERNSLTDTYTGQNASGTLQMRFTGSGGAYNFWNKWSIFTGLMGETPQLYYSVASPILFAFELPPEENYFNIKLVFNGLDITEEMGINLSLGFNSNSITNVISGLRSYSTDPYSLKKKRNDLTGIYSEGNDLGFLLTQGELDSVYSSEAYTNNPWTVSLGDLDF